MSKEIIAAGGKIVLVDEDDYPNISKHKWNLDGYGYAGRLIGGRKNQKRLRMHRVIMSPEVDQVIHHIDGNRLNNCKSNLLATTKSEHRRHHGLVDDCKRGPHHGRKFKGVTYQKGGWQVQIRKGGKTHYIGRYPTAEDAAIAYDLIVIAYRGEGAYLNFPEFLEAWKPFTNFGSRR